MHEKFRYQNFFETQKGSPTNFFGTLRQKISTENSDIPFLCIKFFDTQNFLKHSPTKFFGTVRQKNSTEKHETPPPPLHLLSIKFFPY